jgi:hypothetical protein
MNYIEAILDAIKAIDVSSAAGLTMFFFSMVAPGILTILLFDHALFLSLDVIKLILLALSFASPGVIVPMATSTITFAIFTRLHQVERTRLGTTKDWLFRHELSNAFNMYLLIFISYIFTLSFTTFLWCFLLSIISSCAFELRHMIQITKDPSKHQTIELP